MGRGIACFVGVALLVSCASIALLALGGREFEQLQALRWQLGQGSGSAVPGGLSGGSGEEESPDSAGSFGRGDGAESGPSNRSQARLPEMPGTLSGHAAVEKRPQQDVQGSPVLRASLDQASEPRTWTQANGQRERGERPATQAFQKGFEDRVDTEHGAGERSSLANVESDKALHSDEMDRAEVKTSHLAQSSAMSVRSSSRAAAIVAKSSHKAVMSREQGARQVGRGAQTRFLVNGEPKSGTTWFEYLGLIMLQHRCAQEPSCEFHHEFPVSVMTYPHNRRVSFDVSGKHGIPFMPGHGGSFCFDEPPAMSDADIDIVADKVVKDRMGTGVFLLPIFRDPRAVLVSACHFRSVKDCNIFAETYISAFAGWIDIRHRIFHSANKKSDGTIAHIMFYERLKANFVEEVRNLSAFVFGSPLSDADIDIIQQNTSVEAMQAKEGVYVIPKGPKGAKRIRQGSTCGFQADLSQETLTCITSVMRQKLNPLLNDAWRCDVDQHLEMRPFLKFRLGQNNFYLNGDPESGAKWLQLVLKLMLEQTCLQDSCCRLRGGKIFSLSGSVVLRAFEDRYKTPFFEHGKGADVEDPPKLSNAKVDATAQAVLKSMKGRLDFLLSMLRDPRAVLIAACYQAKQSDCNAFAEARAAAAIGWVDLRYRFFQSLARQGRGVPVHLVFYEQLRDNFVEEARRLSAFVFGSPAPDAVFEAVRRDAFDSPAAVAALRAIGEQASKLVGGPAACEFRQALSEATSARITAMMHARLDSNLTELWIC